MKLRRARLLDLGTGLLDDPADLHVADGRMVRCGAPDEPDEVDLDGRVVVPGLWDAHVHMNQWAMERARFDVSAATSAQHCARLAGELVRPGSDEVQVGRGFRDSRWADQPSLELLDETCGATPVVLCSGDLHSVWLNSAALQRLGLPAGRGHLVEGDAFHVEKLISEVAEDALDECVAQAAAEANKLGLVGITDLEIAWNPGAWQRRSAAGQQGLRVRTGVYAADLQRAIDEQLWSGKQLDEAGLVTMGPLKVIADGSLTARTAWCHDDYCSPTGSVTGQAGERGTTNIAPDELAHLMSTATEHGIDCAIHAIGDAAASMVLDGFEASGAHGSVEHAQLLRFADIDRMAALGVRASVQPSHLCDDAHTVDALWGERATRAFPLASLRAAGVELAFGSDAPVSPLNPWQAIADAVLREASGEVWHPEQRVGLSAALLASTNRVARLVPGAAADLAVLDENPFDVEPSALRGFGAWLTMVGGRIVHRAG